MDELEVKPETRTKRRYVRPVLERVELKPDEAVLGACKTTNRTGPVASSCGGPAPCYSKGS